MLDAIVTEVCNYANDRSVIHVEVNDSRESYRHLVSQIGLALKKLPVKCLVIVTDGKTDISNLNEDDMRKYGWCRIHDAVKVPASELGERQLILEE